MFYFTFDIRQWDIVNIYTYIYLNFYSFRRKETRPQRSLWTRIIGWWFKGIEDFSSMERRSVATSKMRCSRGGREKDCSNLWNVECFVVGDKKYKWVGIEKV